jgi:hypothetical protein
LLIGNKAWRVEMIGVYEVGRVRCLTLTATFSVTEPNQLSVVAQHLPLEVVPDRGEPDSAYFTTNSFSRRANNCVYRPISGE